MALSLIDINIGRESKLQEFLLSQTTLVAAFVCLNHQGFLNCLFLHSTTQRRKKIISFFFFFLTKEQRSGFFFFLQTDAYPTEESTIESKKSCSYSSHLLSIAGR
jgi:hypothetical protein